MIRIAFLIIFALLLGLIFALIYGTFRWQSITRALRGMLESSRQDILPKTYKKEDLSQLDKLPVVVQKYFAKVLPPDQPIIAAVTIYQQGKFNMSESKERWKKFTANQRVITNQAGFDWEGQISFLPAMPVVVHDAYIAGEGILHASFFGLFSLVKLRDKGILAQGELLRFFAECLWYPTALLPSQGVIWQGVDKNSCLASLSDGINTVELLFKFNNDDLIESVRAENRPRAVGNEFIPTIWQGEFSNYQEKDGILIPISAEVSWILRGKKFVYWRGDITDISYEYVK